MSQTNIPTKVMPAVSMCNPWKEPLKCPLIIFIIIVVLALIWAIVMIANLPATDKNGRQISTAQKVWFGVIIFIIYLIIAILFGVIIYNYCLTCNGSKAWLALIVFLILPIIIAILIGAVIGSAYGTSALLVGFV